MIDQFLSLQRLGQVTLKNKNEVLICGEGHNIGRSYGARSYFPYELRGFERSEGEEVSERFQNDSTELRSVEEKMKNVGLAEEGSETTDDDTSESNYHNNFC